MSRRRANNFTVTRTRPAPPSARRGIVRVSRGAFDPHVATLEEFALPDRRNLLDAFDGVPARGKCVSSMWRCGCDGHACAANFNPPDPVVQGQLDVWPCRLDFATDAFECPQRERFVRLIFQVVHLSSDVMVPDET